MFEIDISRRQLAALCVFSGLLVGAAAGYLGSDLGGMAPEDAGERVVSTLEKQSDQDLELIKVDKENGLYRVDVRDSEGQGSTFHVTRDGSKLTTGLIDIGQTRRVLDARSNFSDCLSERNVVMYGNLTQQQTQVQIQLLGGSQYAEPIYKDINNPQNLQEATNRGVEAIPSFYHEGSVMQGVNEIEAIEEFTGCTYDVEEQG